MRQDGNARRSGPVARWRRALSAGLLVLAAAGSAFAGELTARVSVAGDGSAGDADSLMPAISGDGSVVAFESFASNLAGLDANGERDVFAHDRLTGVVERVSVDLYGDDADAASRSPSLSGDGRVVAFESLASDLVAEDTNGQQDVFVRDRTTGATTRASISSAGGEANGPSFAGAGSISADGRYVVFVSFADDLVADDVNGEPDVFLRDLAGGTTSRVSVADGGGGADGPSLSATISADGRFVAFASQAANLVAEDTNGQADVFVRDLAAGTTTRESLDPDGAEWPDGSDSPSIAGDGSRLVFVHYERRVGNDGPFTLRHLMLRDRSAAATREIDPDRHWIPVMPALSADGRFVTFAANGRQVLVHEIETGATRFASLTPSGEQGNFCSACPAISADGRVVAFKSRADDLIAGDDNFSVDVFVRVDTCGNGLLDPGETCDDGNPSDGDGCDRNCTPTGCGNGIVTAGEACDDGNASDEDACRADCTPNVCGDGSVDPASEQCDDANHVDGDGCDGNCTITACGNGIRTSGEECDDGNPLPNDGCEPTCTPTRSGGTYPVGVTTFTTSYRSGAAGERSLVTEVWYPAARQAFGEPFDPVSRGVRDARHAPGRFPLVVFSHGLSGGVSARTHYAELTRHLASHGFIVAAPDHPADTLQNLVPNMAARPRDLRALIDLLVDPRRVPRLLRGHVDRERVAAAGHSFGGFTALATATTVASVERDSRVKAVLGLAPAAVFFTAQDLATVRVPTMILGGRLDPVTPFVPFQLEPYGRLGVPKLLVELGSEQHYFYLSSREPTYAYAVAFLRTYLGDDAAFASLLRPGSASPFGDVVLSSEPGLGLLPGGQQRSLDCFAELASPMVDPLARSPRRLECRDGDPCDTDPAPRRCGFDVALCLNQVDRHVVSCVPRDVASVTIRESGSAADLALLATRVREIVPTADRRCTELVRLGVDVPVGKRLGRRLLRADARSSDGAIDRDRFDLRCSAP